MGDWSNPKVRLIGIDIRRGAAQDASAVPGPAEVSTELHVGVGYHVVLESGRVVHEGGLTVHGAAGEMQLPDELAAAVERLWAHATRAASTHEDLKPA